MRAIGDYGILVYGGFNKKKALFWNYITAITVIIGGIVGWLIADKLGDSITYLLPFAAGSFTYVAASDLIPEIKHDTKSGKSLTHFVVFIIGIAVIYFVGHIFE